MKPTSIVFVMAFALASTGLFGCGIGEPAAKSYPSGPITAIVPGSPGAGGDLNMRALAVPLGKLLKTNVLVENEPGAGGAVALARLARTAPDGYTIVLNIMPQHQNNSLINKVEYDPLGSFEYLGLYTHDPAAVFVKADGPYKTMADLMDAVRKQPLKVSIGSSSRASVDYLIGRSIEIAAGGGAAFGVVNMDSGMAINAVMGGNLDAGSTTVSGIMGQFKSGQVRVLAAGSDTRIAEMPGVPSFREAGVNLLAAGVYRGLNAPKGLPSNVKSMLVKALKDALEDPDFKKDAARMGLTLTYVGPDDALALAKNLLENGKKVLSQ